MSTNYIAPIWRMPINANKDKLSNYSMEFDAGTSSQAIDCGTGDNVNITGPISISVWFNASGLTSSRGIVCKNDNAAQQNFAQYFFDILSGSLRWRAGASTVTYTVQANQWYHAVGTYDGSNITLYIDGAQVATAAASASSYQSNEPMYIGRRLGQSYFGGKIAQVCIFDYALTDGTGGTTNQIEYLYNLNNPMAITGGEPVAYWPLGDNSNPNANRGFPNISVGADSVFDFVQSSTPYDYINLGENVIPSTPAWTSLTVSGWVKKDAAGNFGRVIGKDDGGSNRVFLLQVQNNQVLSGSIRTAAGTSWQNLLTTTQVNIGEWQHVAMTFEGGQAIKLFINGQEEANASTTITSLLNRTTDTLIGAKGNITNLFDGEISNVQIWDVALTNPEMLQIYNNGQPLMTGTQPQQSSLTAWYKLNQSANWEADTVGNWQIPDNRSAYPQSFEFDAVDDQIDGSTNITLDGDFSISFWANVYDPMPATYGMICAIGGTYFAVVRGSRGLLFDDATSVFFSSNYVWEYSEWFNVVLVKSGTTLQYYINGEPDSTTGTSTVTTSGALTLGRWFGSGGAKYKGNLSNFQLWDTALSAAQAETIYNEGVPLTTAIASNNLKAWYKLDNTELFDGNSWSVENQKYPASYESALKFPGNFVSGTGIRFSNLTINVTQANTYSAWVYPIGRLDYWTMLTGEYSGTTPRIAPISLRKNGGSQWCIRSTQRSMNTVSNTVVSNPISNNELNKWHHIMVVVDNLDVSFYLNGQPHGTATFTNPWTNSTFDLFTIGEFANWVADGYMSNIAIWDSDQSTNIANIYNNGTPQNSYTVEPIALWKLDNTTTGINDIIGGRTGTLTGDITKVNTFVSTEAGKSSGMTEQNLVNNNVSALNGESSGMNTTNLVQSNLTRKVPFSNYSTKFDGIEYYTDTGGGFLNGATTASVSVWMKMETIPGSGLYQPAVSCWGSSPLNQYLIRYRTGNGFEFYLGGPSGPSSTAFVVATFLGLSAVVNTWYNIVGTWDGSEVKIYVNGAFGGSQTATSGSINSSTQPNLVGRYSSTNIDGYISNTAFWTDTVLNEDDILNIYNNGVTQDLNNFRVPPTNWLPLDESYTYFNGSVMVARDVIGGGELDGVNVVQSDMVGNAPGSEANGAGYNLAIGDLKGNMYNSDKNAYSVNMADYADGVTNPANSGRSTDTP